jgi:iron complex outermembrane receptor protein
VLTPWQGGNLSVDWYRIDLDNLIGTDNTMTIVQNNRPGDVVRDARGKLVAVYNRYQNLSRLTTSGFDVELHQRWRTQSFGELGVSSVYTHVRDYRRPQTTGGPLVDYAGTNLGASFSLPADKATTTVDWNIGDFRTAATWYHTGSYDQKASAAASAVQSRVDAYEQFDLYAGWSGFQNLTVYTKVENLFDEQPPYDASFPGIRAPYDFTQYDLRGRTFLIGIDYRL